MSDLSGGGYGLRLVRGVAAWVLVIFHCALWRSEALLLLRIRLEPAG